MSDPPRVGLLFGGRSVEHEVSLDSARNVAAALEDAGYVCVPLAVTGEGRWLSPQLSRTLLAGNGRRAEPAPGADDGARVVVEPGPGGLSIWREDGVSERVEVDIVFPLIHGWGGEDGRVQGALDLAGIPCVGAGVCGSALGMDKVLAHQLFDSHGLPGVRWIAFEAEDHRRSPETTRRRVERELDFPVFVKPSNGGSSVGVTRVVEATDLGAAMQRAFEYDGIVLVEQGIDAREIECAVLGNRRAEASVLGEIVPSREFYSYEAKYEDGTSRLTIPAELDPERTEAIRGHAVTAFHCLGLRGMARVDFLVGRASGLVYLNEVNSLPGFTSISMFPRLWEASGLALPELVRRLVDLAFEQWHAERSLRTAWRTE